MKTRIMIADDHKLMREGLRTLIAEQNDMEVVAEAETGAGAVRAAETARPDIVIMDISMPDMNGIDATRAITGKSRSAKVIGLSMHADTRMVLGMFSAGAAGYLLKDCAFDEVIDAIGRVSLGGGYVSPKIAASLLKEYIVRLQRHEVEFPGHTGKRERDVLQMLTEGKDMRTIASELHTSAKAVEALCRQLILDNVVPGLCIALNIRDEGANVVLTVREKEILSWVKEGKNNWEIAAILEITQDTVKFHLKNIFQKLNVGNRSQAIAAALEQNLM